MNNKSYQVIIFDWDGTLSDSSAHIVDCVHYAGETLGLSRLPPERIRHYIGIKLERFMRHLYPDESEKIYRQLIEAFNKYYFLKRDNLHLYPGARDTVLQLHADGYDLAIATGKTREGLQLALQETGLQDIIKICACGDDGYTKPDPRILQYILDVLNIEAKDALMIGDTSYDMQLANNAGVDAIGVAYGMHNSETLSEYNPLTILSKMPDLLTWLDH